jgi:uridine kinase
MSDTSRTDVRPEYAASARTLLALLDEALGLATRDRPVIGIAGESGSGKSATASSLARALDAANRPTVVLHQDDFFRLPPHANHARREADIAWVGPREVDLALIESAIEAFRAGADGVPLPSVNYAADSFDTVSVDFGGARVLVVEGTYVLGMQGLDLRVFLEATYEDTRERRKARARDVDSPFVERVLAIEHAIIARQAGVADVLIDREFVPRLRRGR